LLLGLFLIWNWRLASVTALNPEHVAAGDLLTLLAWKSAIFAGLALGLFAVFRTLQKTALGLAYGLVVWLLGAGLVAAWLSGAVLSALLQLILILAAGFIAHYAITRHTEITGRIVAVFGAVVIGMQAPGLTSVLSTHSIDASLAGLEADLPPPGADEARPHIIYIVPDRYASNANLRDLYGVSNADFTAQLEAHGFHVWDGQNANYPKTFVSLASTLNGDYLDPVLDQIPQGAASYSYLSPLIQDFAARRALQARGYAYTHIGSWWGPTKANAHADRNFNDQSLPFNQLTTVYLAQTPLMFLLARAEAQQTPCDVVADKTALIREQVRGERPQFIFWHAFVTHDPYIFAPDGSCRELEEERYFADDYAARTAAYLQHVEQFNAILLELIAAVRAEASRDVIFVIQSDEGPYPAALVRATEAPGRTDYNYLEAPRAEMRRKHGVFNAIYLPSGDYEAARDATTPVNNFRLIFRELTGEPVPLLPDRAFSFAYEYEPYDLEEVSDQVRGAE
jgi:hypothetical protein